LPRGHVPAPLSLAQGVELSAALRLVQYRHAVHELPADEACRTPPDERAVSLLVYRSPEHEVRYLELTPLARGILERLLAGDSLGGAVQAAATAEGRFGRTRGGSRPPRHRSRRAGAGKQWKQPGYAAALLISETQLP
jgi:hypothetical protein